MISKDILNLCLDCAVPKSVIWNHIACTVLYSLYLEKHFMIMHMEVIYERLKKG